MKRIKQAISIVLITILAISMVPFSSFATTEEESIPELTIGEVYSGKKDSNEYAILKFTLKKAAQVKFKINITSDDTAFGFGYSLLTPAELSNQNISEANTSFDDPTGNFLYSFDSALNSGEYILRLRTYPDKTKIKYKVYTSKTDGRESFPEMGNKNDNSLKNANTIELNKKYYGFLADHSIDSYDVYKFTILDEDLDLLFSLKCYDYAGYFLGGNYGSYILYNSDGKKIKNADLGNFYTFEENRKEAQKYQCTFKLKSGTYYLAIYNGMNHSMNYSFEIHKHNYTLEGVIPPNCVAEGYTIYKCSYCGGTYYDYNVSPTGKHSNKTTTTKATTSEDGKKVTACTVCGKISQTAVIPKIASISLSSTSYTYDGNVKTPKVTVKDSKGKALVKNTDYTVTYPTGRKDIGQYAVKITLKGNYSGSKTLTFNIVPPATSKIAVAQSANAIKAAWKAVSGTTGYKVYLYNGSKLVKAVVTKNTSYTFTSLSAGTTYKVYVKAYKTVNGKNFWSASKSLSASTRPGTPTLSAAAGTKKATLKWNKQTGATGYVVYMATSKTGKYSRIAVLKGNSAVSFTKTGLTKGRTYYFKVAAYKTVGSSNLYGSFSSVKAVKVK